MTKNNICVNCPKYCQQSDLQSFKELLQGDLNKSFKEIIFNCDFCKDMIEKLKNANELPSGFESIKIGIRTEKKVNYV